MVFQMIKKGQNGDQVGVFPLGIWNKQVGFFRPPRNRRPVDAK